MEQDDENLAIFSVDAQTYRPAALTLLHWTNYLSVLLHSSYVSSIITAKKLKALKVIIEVIGGLWLDSVADGVYLPLMCKFQLLGSRVHALSIEDLDLGAAYSSIKSCEFPLALLLLHGDEDIDIKYRILNSKLPKISKEDQDAAKKTFHGFQRALSDLGGNEQEIVDIFDSIALMLQTDAEDFKAEHTKDSADLFFEEIRQLNYGVLKKVLQLLQKAFIPNCRGTESGCTHFSKPRQIALYAVPNTDIMDTGDIALIEDVVMNFCAANTKFAHKTNKNQLRDCRTFYHNHLADKMFLLAHTSDLQLVPHFTDCSLRNSDCVENAVHAERERLTKYLQELGAGSSNYSHYMRECNYAINAGEGSKLDVIKEFLITANSSKLIFVHGLHDKSRLQSIVYDSATRKDSTVLCAMASCRFCSSFEKASKCIIKVTNDTMQACKASMDQSKKNDFNNDINLCLKSSSKIAIELISKYNVDPKISFLFKHTMIHCLMKQWQIEIRIKLKQLDAIALHFLQIKLENFDKNAILKLPVEVQSSHLLEIFESWLLSKQRSTITDFIKHKVEKYFNALVPRANIEMDFIHQLKKFLTLEQAPSSDNLKLAEFATGNADFEHLRRLLKTSKQNYDKSERFQMILNTKIKNFQLLPLLKKCISDFFRNSEHFECGQTRTLEINGMALELRHLLPLLKNKLAKSVQHVRIIAEEILHIDCSLDGPEWSGVHLYIRTNYLKVHETQVIDVSGKEIAVQTFPIASNTNGRGDDGINGLNGTDGGDIIIDALNVENGEGLTLLSNGGNGRPGQDGGNGRDGTDGAGLDPATFKTKFDSSFKTKCKPRLHMQTLDAVKTVGSYIEAEEKTSGLRMIYNYEAKNFNKCSFFICFGTQGTMGLPGGYGGQGGIGGNAGTVIAPCDEIKTEKRRGADGTPGKAGASGLPGRNGWDIGCTDGRHRKARYYGLGQNMRLRLVKHATEAPYRVFCSYFESYIEICAEASQTTIENYIISSQHFLTTDSTKVHEQDNYPHTRLLSRKHQNESDVINAKPVYLDGNVSFQAIDTAILYEKLLKALDEHYNNCSKLFFIHGISECSTKNLLHERYTESALKFLILANSDLNNGNVNRSSATMQKVLSFKCDCLAADKAILMEFYSKSSQSELIQSYINILSLDYFSNYPFLHLLAERIYFGQGALDSQSLLFILDFIINSFSSDKAEIVLVLWCIAVRPMAEWVKELTQLHFQNIFKENDTMSDLLSEIKHIDAIILLNDQLRSETASSGFVGNKRTIEIILQRLAKQPKELPVELSQLKLRDWHKVLKLSFLRAILSVEGKQDDKAVCSLLKVEQQLPEKAAAIFDKIAQKTDVNEESKRNEVLQFELNQKMDNLKDVFNAIKFCTIARFNLIRKECDLACRDLVYCSPAELNKALENIKRRGGTTQEYLHLITYIESQIQKTIVQFTLRPTQKVAILLLLLNDRRTILRVGTGEGKSLIIAIVAIVKALVGQKVHIISSSHVLAQRDSKDVNLMLIYKTFKIAVSNNCCHGDINDRRESYRRCSVIYGILSSFQRDYLLHTFYQENLEMDHASFCKRTCIVDEVDSMLLDKGNNSLYLSHEIPGFEKLDSVFTFIWERINHYISHKSPTPEIKTLVSREFWSELCGIVAEKDIVQLDSSLDSREVKIILAALKALQLIDQNGTLLLNSVSANLSYVLNHYLEKKNQRLVKLVPKLVYFIKRLTDKKSIGIKIPKFLISYVEENLEQWIESALAALQLTEKRDYVLENISWPRIVMIDRDTGTDVPSAEWDEALHQFLQIKHGVPQTTLKLKSVFISNTSYLKKYAKLCGLTGTLGSMAERNLLQEIYDVDLAILPHHKPTKFTLLEPKVLNDINAWSSAIKMEIKKVFEEKRAILIVCSTVKDVEFLNKEIQGDSFFSVFTYLRESDSFGFEITELTGETIIISTNLAGRGTDIKLSPALIESGGLHVCVAYLPPNDRVEEQALGRAARHGAPGSGRVICYVNDSNKSCYHSLIVDRACQEIKRLADIKRFYETDISLEEKCLELFHKTYSSFENDIKKCIHSLTLVGQDGKGAVFNKIVKEILRRFMDRWAMWLNSTKKLLDIRSLRSSEDYLKRLETFLMEVTYNGWKNILAYNAIANAKLIKLFAQNGLLNVALDLCDLSVENEPDFSGFARYSLSFSALKVVKEDHLHTIVKHLQIARSLFEQEVMYLDFKILHTQHASNMSGPRNFVTRQLLASKRIYETFLESLQNLLGKNVDLTHDFFPRIRDDLDHVELLQEIQVSLLKENVIKCASITEALDTSVLDALSFERGLPPDSLLSTLKKWGKGEESKLIEIFNRSYKMPSKELFWKQLAVAIVDEYELVMVSLATLQAAECEIFEAIRQSVECKELKPFDIADLSEHISNDCFILHLNTWSAFPSSEYLLIDEEQLRIKVYEKAYVRLKEMKIVTNHKVAIVNFNKFKDLAFDYFDTLDVTLFAKLEIAETSDIIAALEANSMLKREGDQLKLKISFSSIEELDLLHLQVYSESVKKILELSFAFRGAHQNILENASNNMKCVICPSLPEEMETELFHALVAKGQIQRQIVNKVPSKSDIVNIVSNIIDGTTTTASDTAKHVGRNLFTYLKSCESSLGNNELCSKSITDELDFAITSQFSPIGADEITIDKNQSVSQWQPRRLINSQLLLALGKALYVTDRVLQVLVDGEIKEAHNELFHINIPVLNQLFDKNSKRIIETLMQAAKYSLKTFQPHIYSCIETGSKHLRPQLKRALEFLAKIYLSHSKILKSEQLALLQFGVYEDRLRAKLNLCELKFKQKIVLSAFESSFRHHFKFIFQSFIDDCIEKLREVDSKELATLKFNEQLQNIIVEKICPFLDKCLQSIQESVKQNILVIREWNCQNLPSDVNQLLEWREEDNFKSASKDLIGQLFPTVSKKRKNLQDVDVKYLKKQEMAFKRRLEAEVTKRVTSPLHKECIQNLAVVLSKEILQPSEYYANTLIDDAIPFKGVAITASRERGVFETSLRKLLDFSRDPTLLAHAIKEEVPLRPECVIELLPSIQRFLKNKSFIIAIRQKGQEQIPGTFTIFLDIIDKEFVTIVGGTASVFSKIIFQTDWEISECTFKNELALFLNHNEEYANTFNPRRQRELRDATASLRGTTPLNLFENELVKYIDVAIQILNGKSSDQHATPEAKIIPTIYEKEHILKKAF